jgi:hypothetical protein
MIRSAGLCIAILAGLATPVMTWAASGGAPAAHPFAIPRRSFAIETRAQSGLERQKFEGLSASDAYSTLLSGTFPVAPDAEGGTFVPPPYPPYYVVQYVVSPPPQRCVRPLLIHVGPSQPAKNLPRLVYGTPFDCAG